MTANEVRALRGRLGMDPQGFARLVGVDLRTVQRWESGKVQPSGAAEAVILGVREKLEKDPDGADMAIKFIVGAAAVGGLAYLLIKLLDSLETSK